MSFFLVTVIAVSCLIALFVIGNRLSGNTATGQDPLDHRGWNLTDPSDFDSTKVAGLNEYPGEFEFDIVGESHHQESLERLCNGKTEDGHALDTDALLVPYRNRHDSHAVAVLMGDSEVVGHLSRDDARKLRIAMSRMNLGGCYLKVPGRIVGGWKRANGDEGHFGVKLDLPV